LFDGNSVVARKREDDQEILEKNGIGGPGSGHFEKGSSEVLRQGFRDTGKVQSGFLRTSLLVIMGRTRPQGIKIMAPSSRDKPLGITRNVGRPGGGGEAFAFREKKCPLRGNQLL